MSEIHSENFVEIYRSYTELVIDYLLGLFLCRAL